MENIKIVIGIAVIIFIITIIYFWYFNYIESTEYPPIISNCPANWKVNSDGTCNIPTDGINMGHLSGKGKPIYRNKDNSITDSPDNGGIMIKDTKGNPILGYTGLGSKIQFPNFPGGYDINHPEENKVDFTSLEWAKYGSTLCANRKWAITNNIYWEGVTNYNDC
jgi:hypothetical protein